MDRVKYFEVSERSISTNCKVNSDIQTVNYPQNTKYRLTQQIKHIFGSERKRKALLVLDNVQNVTGGVFDMSCIFTLNAGFQSV